MTRHIDLDQHQARIRAEALRIRPWIGVSLSNDTPHDESQWQVQLLMDRMRRERSLRRLGPRCYQVIDAPCPTP